MKEAKRYLILLVLFLWQTAGAWAQCAMCSATNESALQENTGIGINEGIIYLMGIPYLLLGLLGFLFFRKKIAGFFREFSEIHK